MKKLKKGFTIIELLIVIAIIGILATTVTPKLIKEMRKATVATVQHKLGVVRSRLSLDETLSEEFPNLANEDGDGNTDLLKIYSIESTPGFTDSDGKNYEESSEVVTSRTNKGGWFYIRDTGEIYANLPDGAYTRDKEYEIWDELGKGGEVVKLSDPVGGDWDKFIEGAIKEGTSPYGEISFIQGDNGSTINPQEWNHGWDKVYLYNEDHNLILNPDSDDGSYKYENSNPYSNPISTDSTKKYVVVFEKTDENGNKTHLYSDPKYPDGRH